MTPERFQQVAELFRAACELGAEERAAYLHRACADDAELRREVESLLASHEQAGGFLSEPAAKAVAQELTESEAESVVGRRIDHFQVLSLLGKGGMGEVYLAEDVMLGRKVALKFLPAEFTTDADRVIRFEREARAASSLNHPNIITVYEVRQHEETHYIAYELVEGRTLRQRLATGHLPISEALDIAIQTASALAAVHKAGIIHRDIKPENIMLRGDGDVKVLDFGLAKLTQQTEPDTEKGVVAQMADQLSQSTAEASLLAGTAGYMSPEQARGMRVDTRTDLFSLGVTLYEMAAGRAPFVGESVTAVVRSILEEEPAPLDQFSPEAPDELLRIVKRALRKERAERYQTAAEMLRDLVALKEMLKASPEKPSHKSKFMTAVFRPLTLGAVMVALIITGLWIWRSNTNPGRNQPQPASPGESAPASGVPVIGGAPQQNCLQSITVDNVMWCITNGSGERHDGGLVLRPVKEKGQAWVMQPAASLDCVFDLIFSVGKGDSSVGLEIWARLDPHTLKEYSLTFRGGAVRIVSKGLERKMRLVKSYAGRPIKVHLKVSPEWLYAEIDGRVLIDQKNTYWQGIRLQPRLNADTGDTITLRSCSCT
jgi:serine/threonine protein kinase